MPGHKRKSGQEISFGTRVCLGMLGIYAVFAFIDFQAEGSFNPADNLFLVFGIVGLIQLIFRFARSRWN